MLAFRVMRAVAARFAATALLAAVTACQAAPAPSSPPEGIRLTPAAPVDEAGLDALRLVVERRLEVLRPGATTSISDGGLFVTMPAAEATPRLISDLTAPGAVSLVAVPPGAPPPSPGQRINLPALFGSSDLAEGRRAEGPQQPAVDIILAPGGVDRFARWTETHVGEALAVVQDGVVVLAPIVQEPILNGQLQLSGSGGDEATLLAMAAAVRSGPLPVELEGTVVDPP